MQESSNALCSTHYKPFGPLQSPTGSEKFIYTGKPYDPTTSLYYFGARFYDPATGRFFSEDSKPGIKENPQSMNRYIYAEDNPLKYIDPTGHGLLVTRATADADITNAAVATEFFIVPDKKVDPEQPVQDQPYGFDSGTYGSPSSTTSSGQNAPPSQGPSQPSPCPYGDDGSGAGTDALHNTSTVNNPSANDYGQNPGTSTNTGAPPAQTSRSYTTSADYVAAQSGNTVQRNSISGITLGEVGSAFVAVDLGLLSVTIAIFVVPPAILGGPFTEVPAIAAVLGTGYGAIAAGVACSISRSFLFDGARM